MPQISNMRRLAVAILVGSAVFALGCQPQRQNAGSAPARQESPYIDHIVQYPGETLSIIANWYTGSGRNWELVLDANPGVDPRRIRIGDLIRIPRELLMREDPMPRSAVPGAGGSASGRAARSRPSAPDSNRSAPERAAESAAEAPQSDEVAPDASSSPQGWDWEEQDPASGSEAEVQESDVVEDLLEAESDSVAEVEPAAEAAAQLPSEAPAIEESVDDAASAVDPVAPSGEMRIKTREELLKELLEE